MADPTGSTGAEVSPEIPSKGQPAPVDVVKLVYSALGDPGRRKAAIAAVRALTPRLKPEDWVVKVWAMAWYAQLGELDPAYDLADQLREQFVGQSPTNAWSWLWSREMRPFRRDARFEAFTTRLGLMDFWKQHVPPDDCDLQNGRLVCR